MKLDWYIRIAFSKFLRIWQVCGLNDHKLQRHGECLLRYHSDIFLVHSLTFSAQFTLFCFASTSRTPLPETFRKIRRATVPYRCVPNETTFYRENQISGIHNKCVSVLCTLYYLFIWEKKIDFYKRKLKLADLLCLLQCVVCLRRVIIVLNGKSKLTARTPVYYSI